MTTKICFPSEGCHPPNTYCQILQEPLLFKKMPSSLSLKMKVVIFNNDNAFSFYSFLFNNSVCIQAVRLIILQISIHRATKWESILLFRLYTRIYLLHRFILKYIYHIIFEDRLFLYFVFVFLKALASQSLSACQRGWQ